MASHSEFGKETSSEQVVSAFKDHVRGKIVLITGVSPGGLGEALVLALVEAEPKLIIGTARDVHKAEAVFQTTKKTHPNVMTAAVMIDLSSQQSVRDAAKTVDNLTITVDVLINNAGVMGLASRTLSTDGIEMHFATNFVGHFLFTNLVVGRSLLMQQTIRVVNVTSAGFVLSPIRFSDLTYSGAVPLPEEEQVRLDIAKTMGMSELMPARRESYVPLVAYSHSSTAIMLFTQELARRNEDKNLVAIAASPGVVVTELQRHMPSNFRNPHMFYKTPSQGAASFLVAALDPNLEAHNGAYVDDCQLEEKIIEHARDKEAAKRLWKVTEGLVGSSFG